MTLSRGSDKLGLSVKLLLQVHLFLCLLVMTNAVALAEPATHFVISAPATVTAGTEFSFTVTAQDQSGNIDTGYTGMVHFTNSSQTIVLPADTTLTNGMGTFTTTVNTAGSPGIRVTDTANESITGYTTFHIIAAATTHFLVTQLLGAKTAGEAFSLYVYAKDQFNNTTTNYVGTVHFTSSDGAAVLPGDTTFATGFRVLQVTLKTAGSQTITVTDTANATITGITTVQVIAAQATHFVVSAPATAEQGSTFSFTVAAHDQFGNTDTGYGGTLHFTSSDGAAALPADSTMTNGVGTFAATLNTLGTQTITATDAATAAITGSSGGISVVNIADLAVTISSPATVVPLNRLTYTITQANFGPHAAKSVSISDSLPAGTTFVSASLAGGSGWTISTPGVGANGVVTFSKSAVDPGETAVFQVVLQIGTSLANESEINNMAVISAETLDPNLADNAAVASSILMYPVRIENPQLVYFPTISAAYETALTSGIIEAWGLEFTDVLTFNQYKAITLKGGYDSAFQSNVSITTVNSPLTVSHGSLTVEYLAIK